MVCTIRTGAVRLRLVALSAGGKWRSGVRTSSGVMRRPQQIYDRHAGLVGTSQLGGELQPVNWQIRNRRQQCSVRAYIRTIRPRSWADLFFGGWEHMQINRASVARQLQQPFVFQLVRHHKVLLQLFKFYKSHEMKKFYINQFYSFKL